MPLSANSPHFVDSQGFRFLMLAHTWPLVSGEKFKLKSSYPLQWSPPLPAKLSRINQCSCPMSLETLVFLHISVQFVALRPLLSLRVQVKLSFHRFYVFIVRNVGRPLFSAFCILSGSQASIIVLICISSVSSKFEHILCLHLPFVYFFLCQPLVGTLLYFFSRLFYTTASRTLYIIRILSLFMFANIFPV